MTAQLIKKSSLEEKKFFNISVSKAKTFDDKHGGCKAKYKFSYIDRLPPKEWEHHIFGKFLHRVLENFHTIEKQESLEDHLMMQKAFQQAFSEWKDKLSPEPKAKCQAICQQYLTKLALDKKNNTVQTVIDNEREFFININDQILVKGFIDRVQIDHDGILHIADYKTTTNPKYLEKDFFQLYTYAWSEFLANPELEQIRVSYILLKHEFKYLTKTVTREIMQDTENKFLEYYSDILKEKLFRPSPTPLCDYCDFPEYCPDGKRMMNYLAKKRKEKGKPDPPKPIGFMSPQESNAWAEFGK